MNRRLAGLCLGEGGHREQQEDTDGGGGGARGRKKRGRNGVWRLMAQTYYPSCAVDDMYVGTGPNAVYATYRELMEDDARKLCGLEYVPEDEEMHVSVYKYPHPGERYLECKVTKVELLRRGSDRMSVYVDVSSKGMLVESRISVSSLAIVRNRGIVQQGGNSSTSGIVGSLEYDNLRRRLKRVNEELNSLRNNMSHGSVEDHESRMHRSPCVFPMSALQRERRFQALQQQIQEIHSDVVNILGVPDEDILCSCLPSECCYLEALGSAWEGERRESYLLQYDCKDVMDSCISAFGGTPMNIVFTFGGRCPTRSLHMITEYHPTTLCEVPIGELGLESAFDWTSYPAMYYRIKNTDCNSITL